MRYGSVCSGIEAASCAWHSLGWEPAWFSEIEAFPSAVLAHHYPEVPNLGDMTAIAGAVRSGLVEAPDVLVGGTPCQAFSVAGLRGGLTDARGALTLSFVRLADEIDAARTVRGKPPAVIVWENVPGVLSDKTGAFGCFLGGLAGAGCELKPPRRKWGRAGCIVGPKRTVAWRVLDAQYFGLAQRRLRVFVVASARDGFDPATVLFEWDGVRRDSAPSREAREGSAGRAARSVALRGREGGGTAELGDELQNCLRASGGGGDKPHVLIHADPIARCDTAGEAKRQDWETCNFVAHSLRGEGFDASEDGTGRGTPLVPVRGGRHNSHWNGGPHPSLSQSSQTRCGGIGASNQELFAQGGAGLVPVAYMADDYKDGTFEECDTARPLTTSADRTRAAPIACMEIAGTMKACKDSGGWSNSADHAAAGYMQVTPSMQVRRLTPRECERLQGFPDDYTRIPERFYKAKPKGKHFQKYPDLYDRLPDGLWVRYLADGPRYKALGNSMAVPVMRWIGSRIAGQAYPAPTGTTRFT